MNLWLPNLICQFHQRVWRRKKRANTNAVKFYIWKKVKIFIVTPKLSLFKTTNSYTFYVTFSKTKYSFYRDVSLCLKYENKEIKLLILLRFLDVQTGEFLILQLQIPRDI